MARSRQEVAWWLEGGTEVCPSCKHPYAYQTEFYCMECDGPVCAVCVVKTVALEHACPSCFTTKDSQTERWD